MKDPNPSENTPHPAEEEPLPEGVILRDHVVDGIREYDQRLPKWWLMILFGVIFFSIIYWVVQDQHDFSGQRHAQLEERLAAIETKRMENSIDVTDNARFWEMSENTEFVSAGKEIYDANCVACHGQNLGGGIGVNLVDNEWKHGSAPSDIYTTIRDGVPEKGMQAWESLLGQKRMAQVVAYILSHHERPASGGGAGS